MIAFLQIFQYLAAVIVALSIPVAGLAAFFFLAFCDHGPPFLCFLLSGLAVGAAFAQVALLARARTLLKQRQRLYLSAGLMILSILPVALAVTIFLKTPV